MAALPAEAYTPSQFADWLGRMGYDDARAAEVLGIAPSTVAAYQRPNGKAARRPSLTITRLCVLLEAGGSHPAADPKEAGAAIADAYHRVRVSRAGPLAHADDLHLIGQDITQALAVLASAGWRVVRG